MAFVKSILVLPIIFAMLLSSTGLKISQHWCGDELINSSIWGEASVCDHYKQAQTCPHHGRMMQKNCCNKKEVIVDSIDGDIIPSFFQVEKPVTVVAFLQFITPTFELELAEFDDKKYHNHSPPLIGRTIYKMVERFLI